jgi:broad specificity phosphatase PhoE
VTELLLVRHGETDWNVERRWQGHADRPLNKRGRSQARELAERVVLERIDAVYSSDLARALETAQIVARRIGMKVLALRELREVDVGEFSGLTSEEIAELYPAAGARTRRRGYGWEQGESLAEMEARVLGAVRRIAAAHPVGRVLVVGHGGTIRALAAVAAGLDHAERRLRPLVVGNCSVARIACENGALRSLD